MGGSPLMAQRSSTYASSPAAIAKLSFVSSTALPFFSLPADTTASTPAASASAASPASSAASYIGEDAAKDIALKDAGFTAGDVTELKCELDFDAVVHYDVDFKQGGKEYDYDIDATTGAILQSRSEVDD